MKTACSTIELIRSNKLGLVLDSFSLRLPSLFIISSINFLWSILILTPMSMRGCALLY